MDSPDADPIESWVPESPTDAGAPHTWLELATSLSTWAHWGFDDTDELADQVDLAVLRQAPDRRNGAFFRLR